MPSTILQFWDLGGQRGIRNIWHRYYDDCHAVVYVIDAKDRERLSEGWEVFGMSLPHIFSPFLPFLHTIPAFENSNTISQVVRLSFIRTPDSWCPSFTTCKQTRFTAKLFGR